jgi:hypothetical protein
MVIFDFQRKFSEIFASQGAPPVSTTQMVTSFQRFALTTSGKFATGGINNSGNTRKINDVNSNRIATTAESPTTASYKVKAKAESSATAERQATAETPSVVDAGGKFATDGKSAAVTHHL